MINISSVSSDIHFLWFGLHYYFIFQTSSDFTQGLGQLIWFWVANYSNTFIPLRLFCAKKIFIDLIFNLLDNIVNTFTNLIRWLPFKILLVLCVIELTVSNGA